MINVDEAGYRALFFDGKSKRFRTIVLVCAVVFFPLAIKNILVGYYFLGGLLTVFSISLCLSVWGSLKKTESLVPPFFTALLLVLAIISSVYYLGYSAVYWAYPVVFCILFYMPLKQAVILNALLICGVSIQVFLTMEIAIALRVVVSLICTVCISTDMIRQLHELQQKLLEDSMHDPMTGLLNRRNLGVTLNDCLAQHRRSNFGAGIAIIDVDHFKKVNDTLGHDKGDEVLKKVAAILSEGIRESDKVFRIGGEEFLILAKGIDLQGMSTLVEKLRLAIHNAEILPDLRVSVSIGVCMLNQGMDQGGWIKNADCALYEAKSSGRNRTEVFSSC